MITEDYIGFATAKLLKEKGFDIPTERFYNEDGTHCCGASAYNWNDDDGEDCSRPTLQMTMKWLRESHNIDIDIDAKVGMLGLKVYVPIISTYRYKEDASDRVTQKQFGLYYKDDTGIISALQHFDTYEESAEAAILYCLQNLI